MRRMIIAFLMCLILVPARGASLINDTEIEQTLAQIIAPLASAADIAPNRLKINIVHDDDFNAFVRGGDEVFIYTGLLTRIKSPAALQAVVAHELGHTLGGHMAQMSARMNSEMRRAYLIQALGVALMAAGGDPSLGVGVLAGAGGVATSGAMAFTRDEERMADQLGLDLMQRAGLPADGFIAVFEQMQNITGAAESKINPNHINHPLTSERLKNVRAYIAAHPDTKTRDGAQDKKWAAQYELARAKLIGYLDTPARVAALYPARDKSDAAIYARAIANMRGGNLDAAMTGARTLISRAPKNPYFYELLGDAAFQYGHYDDAVDAYDHSLELMDNAPQIETALAMVLTERNKPGDAARAIDLCRRALLGGDRMALTYWTLARAYDDDARADWARAEYYAIMGDKKQAKKYATRAQKKLDSDTPEYIKSGDILAALK